MQLRVVATLSIIFQFANRAPAENEKATLSERPPWTASRVFGSPEPPPPYTVEPVFNEVKWKNPVFAIREPGSEWLIVVEWPQAITTPAESNPSADK